VATCIAVNAMKDAKMQGKVSPIMPSKFVEYIINCEAKFLR